jgi:hypothetical protein
MKNQKKQHFPGVNGSTAFLCRPGAEILSFGLLSPYFRSIFTEYVIKIKFRYPETVIQMLQKLKETAFLLLKSNKLGSPE